MKYVGTLAKTIDKAKVILRTEYVLSSSSKKLYQKEANAVAGQRGNMGGEKVVKDQGVGMARSIFPSLNLSCVQY